MLGIAAGILFEYGANLKSTGWNGEQKTEKVFDKALADNSGENNGGDVGGTNVIGTLKEDGYIYANIRPSYVGDGTETFLTDKDEVVSDLNQNFTDIWVKVKVADDGKSCKIIRSAMEENGDFGDTYNHGGNELMRGEITLPDKITGIPIINIQGSAFTFSRFSGELKLPAGLTSIERLIFQFSRFSGELKLPSGLKSIGEGAFSNSIFNGELHLPEGLTRIDRRAFSNSEFSGELLLPEGLIKIGDSAFQNSKFSGELRLPEVLDEIGVGAFENCHFIGDLKLPENYIWIGEDALKLSSIEKVLDHPDNVIRQNSIHMAEGTFFTPQSQQYTPQTLPSGGVFLFFYGSTNIPPFS